MMVEIIHVMISQLPNHSKDADESEKPVFALFGIGAKRLSLAWSKRARSLARKKLITMTFERYYTSQNSTEINR